MTNFINNKRPSTIKREEYVRRVYKELSIELGELINVVTKSYIYERIGERTGLCSKTIASIINHI